MKMNCWNLIQCFFMSYFSLLQSTEQWPREKAHTQKKWPPLVRVTASVSSLTTTALLRLVHAPEAAVAPLAATGCAAATRHVTGLHHLLQCHPHPAASCHPAPGPALILAATDVPPAVAATATAEMTAIEAPRHARSEPTLAPTSNHPRRTGTRVEEITGHIPGLLATGIETGELMARLETDPKAEATRANPDLQDTLSVRLWMVS